MRNFLVIFFLLIGCGKQKGVYHPLRWEVGQWVAFKINGAPIRISIVGEEAGLFWVETVEPEIIVKVLVEEGKLTEAHRLIVKKIDEPAVEFQVDRVAIKSGLPKMALQETGENELITLQCGKFKVVHIQEEGADAWLSGKVPIFGLVKYKSKDKEIVLCDYGLKGAESEIKGEVKVVSLEGVS